MLECHASPHGKMFHLRPPSQVTARNSEGPLVASTALWERPAAMATCGEIRLEKVVTNHLFDIYIWDISNTYGNTYSNTYSNIYSNTYSNTYSNWLVTGLITYSNWLLNSSGKPKNQPWLIYSYQPKQ